METKIARANFEEDKRVIVISNVHGYLGFLKSVLKKVNYSPYRDILVFNGNIIEKGPHSLQTIRYISQLSDDGDVYLVMGNAEAFQLMFLSDDTPSGDDKIYRYIISRRITYRSCLLSEMFYEMGYPVESAKDIQRAKAELKKRYMPEIMFLNSMPTILETRNLIFVHGGIPNEDLDSFEGQDALQFLKRDAYLEHCKTEFSKYVITGGWPSHLYSSTIQSQRPIIDRKRKIVSIAGGAGYKFDGQLNALIINDPIKGNFEFVYEDGFQEGIAVLPQKASTDSINIRRTSNLVRILEQGAEFSYVQHRATGKKLYMYNRYLHSDEEYTTCEDYTDYVLPVKTGDRLSVLFETSNGYLVKKNGITGWYKGTIELLPREEIITEEEISSMHQGTQIINSTETPKYLKKTEPSEKPDETPKDEGFNASPIKDESTVEDNTEENNLSLDDGNQVDSDDIVLDNEENQEESSDEEAQNEESHDEEIEELESFMTEVSNALDKEFGEGSWNRFDFEDEYNYKESPFKVYDNEGEYVGRFAIKDGSLELLEDVVETKDDTPEQEPNEDNHSTEPDVSTLSSDEPNEENENWEEPDNIDVQLNSGYLKDDTDQPVELDEELLSQVENLDSINDGASEDDVSLEGDDIVNEDDAIDPNLLKDLETLDGASEEKTEE